MLNIYDINYEFCSEKLGNLNFPPETLPKKGIVFRILSLLKGVSKYCFKRSNGQTLQPGSVLFFVIAQNEIHSIKPIFDDMPGAAMFGVDNYKNGYPMGKIYFYSLFFIPLILIKYLGCKNAYHKKSYAYAFDGFCLAYSSRYVLKKYLTRLKPQKIIIANQLSCYHRALANMANELNIHTFYIQHASVTENFSNLNVFTAALLEGEDSLHKYQLNGTQNKQLYLVGMPKFDKYFSQVHSSSSIQSIGICTNGTDDFEAYSRLIVLIKERFPQLQVIVRPHPSDRRKTMWMNMAQLNNCLYSDVRQVESFRFFKEVDLVIAGDSNIHLEAALINIPSIYFDPFGSKIDWYGFCKNGLIEYAESAEEACNFITAISKQIPQTRVKAKYYVDTVNTSFDGKSTALAAMVIKGNNIDAIFNTSTDQFGNTVHKAL